MGNSGKVLAIFLIALLGAGGFLYATAKIIIDSSYNEPTKTESDGAVRGEIVTADGYHLTRSYKTYSIAIDPQFIDPKKYDVFINFFSIYTGMHPDDIRNFLRDGKRTVLIKETHAKMAKNLKELSRTLEKEGVFTLKRTKNGRSLRVGIEVIENDFIRNYPYTEFFEPILGYVRIPQQGEEKILSGVVGIEKFYEEQLKPQYDNVVSGLRDVGGNLVYTKESLRNSTRGDGTKLVLGLNMAVQKQLELQLSHFKTSLQADDIIAGVMDSKTGKIIALASANRYNPMDIRQDVVPHIKLGSIQYVFEPGSIIKPFIFSLLLDAGKINQFQMIDGHLGKFQIGDKVVTDEHKMGMMTAEDAIIYSSNIAMVQIVQFLNPIELHDGMQRFGFSTRSGIDLPYEGKGNLPSINQLRSEIYKATLSYGYGLRANFIQLLKAYNIFNNNGLLIDPYLIVGQMGNDNAIIPFERPKGTPVLSGQTVIKMGDILRKTVQKGTGKITYIEGLDIGGKTGTAHIANNGRYENLYNSSFFGFANDGKNSYTIGVLVVSPKTAHFAAETAVPVFRSLVINLASKGYLTPKLPIPELTQTIPLNP